MMIVEKPLTILDFNKLSLSLCVYLYTWIGSTNYEFQISSGGLIPPGSFSPYWIQILILLTNLWRQVSFDSIHTHTHRTWLNSRI